MKQFISFTNRPRLKAAICTLIIFFSIGIGNAWGDDNPVGTFSSDDVVTGSSYTSYSDDNWTLSRGGGGDNHSCGYNNTNSNKTTIGNAYGTSANTSHYGFTIVGKTNISNAYKMTFEYTGGNTYAGGILYLGYSTNNGSTWSAVPLKSGSGRTGQGGSVGSANTTYTFEFTTAIASARYAIVLSKNTTSSSGQFRFDHVTATFYEEGSSCSTPPTIGASSNSSFKWINKNPHDKVGKVVKVLSHKGTII